MDSKITNIPLITIGITAYNAALTIEYAVQSALAQNWPNTEIIAVDDASDDKTFQILTTLADTHANFHLFKQDENKGVAAARNKIIKKAKGEFIAFFDDDDESTSDRLSKQHKRITDYERIYEPAEQLILCHTARLQKYSDGYEAIAHTAGCNQKSQAPHGKSMLRYLLLGVTCHDCHGAMATCSQMARKNVYEYLGGFDEKLRRAEDTEFTIRHAAAGGHFIGIDEPLVTQIMTLSKDKNLDQELANTLYYLKKHKSHFPSIASYNFQKKWIKAKYAYYKGNKIPLIKSLLRHPVKSLQKIKRAMPNYSANQKFKSFHENDE